MKTILTLPLLLCFLLCAKENMAEQMPVRVDKNRIIIIFKQLNTEALLSLEQRYALALDRCMTKRMCLFHLLHGTGEETLLDRLERESVVEEATFYRQYQLKPY